ncbi:FAST kinase domain-containing protein 2, mitochondrial [Ooceraea biroi]|nr:FAST kinase domain-containing protein 2, mitochondrial [Ooceraea biroi]XP_026829703.1 FAST kinase domain-containing protein 2, mitochondrial [Ooceraea biroi]XP_026829704.1 FAST kinase domain-containing protein 2, mitochondrial [Ooceraea biroi]
MDRALKRFLRLYPIARKWTNYVAPLQSVQRVSYSTNLTDHTQFEDFTLSVKRDISRVKTHTSHELYKTMKMLEETAAYTNMTLSEAMHVITVLFESIKNDRIKDIEGITKHSGFIRLCEVLNRHIRVMNTSEIIECLKIFTYIKVSNDSILIQSLLQMIRTTVNDISLRDIIFIVFLLKKMDSTPLRDALLIALPLVFEIQLPTKLDSDDVSMLTSSLQFISQRNINNSEVQNIILTSLREHRNELNAKMALSILHSLCSMSDLSPIAIEVLYNVQKVLTSNAKELHVRQIIQILHRLLLTIRDNKKHGHRFYNEALIDAFISSALSSNIDFASGVDLLQLLNDLNYVHIPLLEYLAAKCFEQPYLLKGASYTKVFTFIKGFINADYKPVFWDVIRDAILANNMKFVSISTIKFALHMIALDCYNPSLLDKVFSYNVNNIPMKDTCARELLLLYQSVKTLYPNYNGSWPSQDLIQHAIDLGTTKPTYSLRGALELALGGPQYVHNDLKTKLGHHIDHVVIMRKGGYPIAINTIASNKVIYVEDIETPSMSQIILIFNLPDAAYAINSQRLKSTWLLKIKSAEALTNSNTIAINSSSWFKLPEYERVPYLMQAIKLKCEDLSVSEL